MGCRNRFSISCACAILPPPPRKKEFDHEEKSTTNNEQQTWVWVGLLEICIPLVRLIAGTLASHCWRYIHAFTREGEPEGSVAAPCPFFLPAEQVATFTARSEPPSGNRARRPLGAHSITQHQYAADPAQSSGVALTT